MGQETWSNKKWLDEQLELGKSLPTTGNRTTWEALITQSGTASPVISYEITSIDGATLSLSRSSDGSYLLTSSTNLFLQNKVIINGNLIPTTSDAYAIPEIFRFDDLAGYVMKIVIVRYSDTTLSIQSFDGSSTPTDLSNLTYLQDNPLYLKIDILP